MRAYLFDDEDGVGLSLLRECREHQLRHILDHPDRLRRTELAEYDQAHTGRMLVAVPIGGMPDLPAPL
jgi:hypothetical protein